MNKLILTLISATLLIGCGSKTDSEMYVKGSGLKLIDCFDPFACISTDTLGNLVYTLHTKISSGKITFRKEYPLKSICGDSFK